MQVGDLVRCNVTKDPNTVGVVVAIIIGAGALVLSVFAPAPLPLKAGESGAERLAATRGQQLGLNELKARLDRSDRAAGIRRLAG